MKENNSLKFRAWWIEQEVMCDVDVIGFSEGAITVSNQNTTYQHLGLNEVELMQSTGLIDVKGFEIFEEDMVKLTEKTINGGIDTHTCKVFQSKSGAWRLEGHPDFSRKYTTKRELYSVRNRIEIIGNVWENPELLEVAE